MIKSPEYHSHVTEQQKQNKKIRFYSLYFIQIKENGVTKAIFQENAIQYMTKATFPTN